MEFNPVALQYAADLFDTGIIKNKADFWSYFRQHGEPGEELQAVQQIIRDHCKQRMPFGTLADSSEREAEILCRLFPKYELKEARYLLNMFAFRPDRIQLVICIMSLHNRMLRKLPNTRTGINMANNIEADPDETFYADAIYMDYRKDSERHLPQGNMRATSSSTFSNTHIPKFPIFRRTPTATVVRPEDLELNPFRQLVTAEASSSNTPSNDPRIQDAAVPKTKELRPFHAEKITCKPLNALMQSPVEGNESKNVWNWTPLALLPNENTHKKEPVVQEENGPTWVTTYLDIPAPNPAKEERGANHQPSTSASNQNLEIFFETIGKGRRNEEPMNLRTFDYWNKSEREEKFEENMLREKPNQELPDLRDDIEAMNLLTFKLWKNDDGYPNAVNEGNHRDIPDMPLPPASTRHRRHSLSSNSSSGARPRSDSPRPRKYQRLENLIVINEDSDDSDISLTDIENVGAQNLMIKSNKPGRRTPKAKESTQASASYCIKLSSHIMEMFPDACPNYVRSLCTGRKMCDADVDVVLQAMFNNPDYPKRDQREETPPLEMDFETQAELLKEIFPEADPTFLESRAQMYLSDPEAMRTFITKTLESHDLPTKKEYLRRQQLNAQVKQYTTEFNVDKFLEIIPDPMVHFSDVNRCTFNQRDAVERHLCLQVLRNLYPHLMVRYVNTVINNNSLVVAAEILDKCKDSRVLMKSKRKFVPVDLSAVQNIPLLQEIAFLTNRQVILQRVGEKKQQELKEREEAKAKSLMQVCQCCYDDEVMLKECIMCVNGCNFCKSCIQKNVEILFAEGKTEFPCLGICSAQFNLRTLMDALPPKLFSKVAQRKQLEEIKAAGMDDLVMCPFCDFATIPPPGDKIFKCLNPECMKESCRMCKEPSHVPLRCDEVEKDDDIKKRTYIENKMTEALVRICYKCGMKFIKEDGCNKMTCSCGAKMCYLCLAPVTDYTHFNGQGGDKHHLCPLYSDTNTMHENQVLEGAAKAKEELGVGSDEQLKIDPTADVEKHYAIRKSKQNAIPGVDHAPPPIRMVVNAFMEIMDQHDGLFQFRQDPHRHHHHRHHHH